MGNLASMEGKADVITAILNKISDATGWVVNHSTPQRIAIDTYISEIQSQNYDPITKAALISNAKRIIKEFGNQTQIVQNATQFVKTTADPNKLDDDWISQFMDKARLVSDKEFQLIWGRILAEECNSPHSIPKCVLHILEQMDRKDAEDFTNICSFAVHYFDDGYIRYSPIILYKKHLDYYVKNGITYDTLANLQAFGLIEFCVDFISNGYGVSLKNLPNRVFYFDQFFEVPESTENLYVGNVIFTRAGESLCRAISPVKNETFYQDYLLPWWKEMKQE